MVVMVVIGVCLVVVVGLTVVVGRHTRPYVVPDPDPRYRETPRPHDGAEGGSPPTS